MLETVVQVRGDDMARIVGDLLQESIIEPCVDTDQRAFHLSIEHRNQTNDTVTLEATQALKLHNVGVKCATMMAEKDVLEKYQLKRTWMSPNAAIRNALGGDVFRKPIACRNIPPLMNKWRRSIITARHAFGDQYNSQDFVVPGPGTLQIKYSPSIGAYYNHDRLMELYLDANLRAFDLSIEHRKEINDTITLQATQALEVHNVGGVKCAITS
ncbi:isocitrate dehydrogenase [NADP] cytoplasmic-like [Dermacentor silvarum]|uniref:isocitrate dehydrogenase [NADP] cytoplasmic-like n=1 Tax=Dermacentor silvarum TaxID=543639 RepID=UPI0021007DCD|nr:isocitrate dehydrogenase [NADP] cytoplasmic-like [Dermacentor silvarum]